MRQVCLSERLPSNRLTPEPGLPDISLSTKENLVWTKYPCELVATVLHTSGDSPGNAQQREPVRKLRKP